MRKWSIAGLLLIVAVVSVVFVSSARRSEASIIEYTQYLTVLDSNSLTSAGQFNFTSGTWVVFTGGGFGVFAAEYRLFYGGYYGLILYDYGSGQYSEILYTLDDVL